MIDYYTKRLGLDGHISKEKMLLQEDKTKIEVEIINLKKEWEEKEKKYNKMFSELKRKILVVNQR